MIAPRLFYRSRFTYRLSPSFLCVLLSLRVIFFSLFVLFAPFCGYSCLSVNLCVFAALREILIPSSRIPYVHSPHFRITLGYRLLAIGYAFRHGGDAEPFPRNPGSRSPTTN